MRPGGGKQKGNKWERDLAEIFKKYLGLDDIKRGIGQCRSASEVADVEGVPGFWVEAKCGKNTAPKRALAQAEKALNESKNKENKKPIAVCKDDRQLPTVTMFLSDFLELAFPKKVKE